MILGISLYVYAHLGESRRCTGWLHWHLSLIRLHCRQQSTSMATRRTTARSILNGAASSPRFLLAPSVQNADFQN